jgi:putative toxin-antitoxin system antitoxin component (TIGR02293 family)
MTIEKTTESPWEEERRKTYNRALRLVGLRTEKQVFKAVERGLPICALEAFRDSTGMTDEEVIKMMSLGKDLFKRSTMRNLTPDEADRLLGIAFTFSSVMELYDHPKKMKEATRHFFRSSRSFVGNLAPMDLVKTENGRREIVAEIGRAINGVY